MSYTNEKPSIEMAILIKGAKKIRVALSRADDLEGVARERAIRMVQMQSMEIVRRLSLVGKGV